MKYGMSLRTLLEGWLDDAPDLPISGITQLPARVRPGYAFVWSPFGADRQTSALNEARARGCVVILHDATSTDLPALGVPCVRVPGLSERLGEMASRYWAAPSDLMTVAAVTGTRGRAEVCGFLAQVWQRSCAGGGPAARNGSGSVTTLRSSSLPAPDVFSLNEALAACVDQGIDQAAVEVSPEALIQGRCQTLQIDLALIGGLGERMTNDHAEKRLLTEFAPRFSVINIDDVGATGLVTTAAACTEMLTVGLSPRADVSARVLTMNGQGMTLRLAGPWGEATVRTELSGKANAVNLLSTAAAVTLLGLDWVETCHHLAYLRPPARAHRAHAVAGMHVALEEAA